MEKEPTERSQGKPKDSDVMEAKTPPYISRQQSEEIEAEVREMGG